MGTICLSPAPNLRCVGLSLTQELITLVPSALEAVFSLGLIFADSDAGRIRYILAAEGPVYLLLVVLSLLNRVIPLFEYSLSAHKILDIAVGAASFIPIFLYMLYLYLFKRRDFFPNLPQRFSLVANAFALAVIPIIIVTNEIGSFLGIRYRMVPGPESHIVGNQAAIGPDLTSFQFGREFLRSTSLALLIFYQVITWLLFFTRLASCIAQQREIESRSAAEREGILFRGIGWLVVGLKISAIESAIGFASACFGIILTRRIMRMLGRACIIIGVLKGVDRREDFLILDSDNLKGNDFLSGTRKLKMPGKRFTISGPQLVRSSMTQRMSRMASLRPSLATFVTPRPDSPTPSDVDVERTPFVSRPSSGLPPDWPIPPSTKYRPTALQLDRISSDSRVDVIHSHNRAPTLVLNLSPMELRSSDIFAAMSDRSANQTSTSTAVDIDYIPVFPMPLSAPALRSAPPPQFVAVAPPGFPPGSSRGRGPRPWGGREPSRKRSSRRRSMPPAAPSIPIGASPTIAPGSPGSLEWPSTESELTESIIESPQPSGGVVPTRSRANKSQSTIGGILIDWIAPEGGADGRTVPLGMARIKSVGAVPRRTTPNPTSAGAVRGSVVLEHHESLGVSAKRPRPQSRREMMPRKDSGVLGEDDPALQRGSPRPR